jgi:hypothetical protein
MNGELPSELVSVYPDARSLFHWNAEGTPVCACACRIVRKLSAPSCARTVVMLHREVASVACSASYKYGKQQDRPCKCNAKPWRVRLTIFAEETQECIVCVLLLSYLSLSAVQHNNTEYCTTMLLGLQYICVTGNSAKCRHHFVKEIMFRPIRILLTRYVQTLC